MTCCITRTDGLAEDYSLQLSYEGSAPATVVVTAVTGPFSIQDASMTIGVVFQVLDGVGVPFVTFDADVITFAAPARFNDRVDINNGIALGGGLAPTLGTIGGTGPSAAAQWGWVEIDVAGVPTWMAGWR